MGLNPENNLLLSFKRSFKSDLIRRIALLLGGAGFGIGLLLAVRSQPQLLSDLKWGPALLVILVGVPLTMVANSFEFLLIGASVKRRIPLFRALEISIIASAANLLPLPGGAITRVAALKAYDVRYGDGILATLIFAFIWVAVAFVFAAIFLLQRQVNWITLGFLFIGMLVGAGSLLWIRLRGASYTVAGWAVVQRSLQVSLGAFRIWWCLLALGLNVSFSQAAAFVVSGVVGSAVSVVPGGLGVREGISAALAPLVGLAAASGFMAAALDRILSLVILAPTAFILGLLRRKEGSK